MLTTTVESILFSMHNVPVLLQGSAGAVLLQLDNRIIQTRIIPEVNRKYFFIIHYLSDTNLIALIE
jgi:hypothetical protein